MRKILIVFLALLVVGCSDNPKPITSPEQKEFMTECIKYSRFVNCERRWELLQEAL